MRIPRMLAPSCSFCFTRFSLYFLIFLGITDSAAVDFVAVVGIATVEIPCGSIYDAGLAFCRIQRTGG